MNHVAYKMPVALLILCLLPRMVFPSAMQQANHRVASSGQWLLSYREKTSYEVSRDPRLPALLWQGLPHYVVPWSGKTLSKAVPYLMGSYPGDPGSVRVESNRSVTISGTAPKEGDVKYLLWCDTAAGQAKMILAIVWLDLSHGGEGRASLDIYTNRKGTDSSLPLPFIASFSSWRNEAKVATITDVTVHDAENHTVSLSPSDLIAK
jgi:hypothetical protein